MTWHRDPRGFPFSFVPRATNPRLGVSESFFKEIMFELSSEGIRVGRWRRQLLKEWFKQRGLARKAIA